jgi:hypothetical protein
MSKFEVDAYSRMLDNALLRFQHSDREKFPVRLSRAYSYRDLASMLRRGQFYTPEAVLLRDHGPAVRVGSVDQLEGEQWPPQGVLAAADGTWVLEQDGRVTRLY